MKNYWGCFAGAAKDKMVEFESGCSNMDRRKSGRSETFSDRAVCTCVFFLGLRSNLQVLSGIMPLPAERIQSCRYLGESRLSL
jgi:hypothetical protein